MAQHWILTCNPKRWGFREFLEEGNTVHDITGWSLARYLDRPIAGDDVALWLSGQHRGVYAVGHVTGEPVSDRGDEHWADLYDMNSRRHFLPVSLTLDLTATPLLAEVLEADTRFAGASVIRQPWAGNPHPVDDLQWDAIVDLLPA